MEELLIIENEFESKNINSFVDFFSNRKIDINVYEFEKLKNYSKNKPIIICHKSFEIKVNGKNSLIKIARNIGCSKILIIDDNANEYSINTELGESMIYLSFQKLDRCIQELILNIVSKQKFSYADPKTHSLINLAKKVAETDVTVFVHGPTGTGKEVVSNFIHNESNRSENPFIAVNCAAIPENMLEAMLFGHEKGAFTGASSANKGIFRAADTGTLLLDEISEMPLSLQAKLLRVLQEKKVTPIGGQRDIEVDVRVIATTNRNMIDEVKEKKFREDLYYRLNVFPIETTNLFERPGDVIPISMALLKRHAKDCKKIPFISTEAQEVLINYTWPGNVRELENVLQRAMVLSNGNLITKKDIMIDSMLNSNRNIIEQNIFEEKKALNV